ncbi:ATPase [Niastella koreensis]|uniref:NAD metabolism ATPase/kinase-like protein n=2 Tax=Niastella koreensis TaxID=354356 RepID=G8TCJ5_NIAKG|nr:ATP-binding protein [Niastella koreensis]AEW02535.1 NAD metabolism ATPase/kinase-like protein [Niastella koreensis GR20-10]OQP54900.1 ATPase [Niastella koreensis]
MKKVVVIGPESTGKSTLCEQLAKYYKTTWVPEYAREYLTVNGMNYTFEDLLTIAQGQVALEESYIEKAKDASLLFIDTDQYVMKVWGEFVFGKCHQWTLDQITKRKYDLYLLCNIDLPWAYDVLREYPDPGPRKKLYNIYRNILLNQSVPWVEISGNYDERFQKAINAVNDLFAQ